LLCVKKGDPHCHQKLLGCEFGSDDLSNEKKGILDPKDLLGYIGHEKLHGYMGIIITNHYKDPYFCRESNLIQFYGNFDGFSRKIKSAWSLGWCPIMTPVWKMIFLFKGCYFEIPFAVSIFFGGVYLSN